MMSHNHVIVMAIKLITVYPKNSDSTINYKDVKGKGMTYWKYDVRGYH